MNEISVLLRDSDLTTMIGVLMPGHPDKRRMVRVLREDHDILEGMLRDEKIFTYLLDNPDSIIKVSPHLFFIVLLYRVRDELRSRSYTVESQNRQRMIVFDSGKVNELLDQKPVLCYLVDMLASFVRINSFTIPIRIRKGLWRKLRFSDFDIDSLIRYSQIIDETHRFVPYRRIADICLFITGVFPDSIGNPYLELFTGHRPLGIASGWNRDGYEQHGRFFYREASRFKAAQMLELYQVLTSLADNFALAAKPLSFMSSRYLGLFKDRIFLQ